MRAEFGQDKESQTPVGCFNYLIDINRYIRCMVWMYKGDKT